MTKVLEMLVSKVIRILKLPILMRSRLVVFASRILSRVRLVRQHARLS